MPIYEFRCSECDTVFEQRRSVVESDQAAPPCPKGHTHTRRVLSVFASVGTAASSGPSMPSTGGCGPGCACAANL